MKKQIKELRVKIDGLAQLTKKLKPYLQEGIGLMEAIRIHSQGTTKEIEKAIDSLYLAKAWLGKVLQELGESTPYANDGKRKTVEDIEPAADKVKEYKNNPTVCSKCPYCRDVTCGSVDCVAERWDIKSHIEKVDWLREEIETVIVKCVDNFHSLSNNVPQGYFNQNQFLKYNVLQHLNEARFWLGFELQRIKEQK